MVKAFNHRTAFGAWINDMRNEGMPNEPWPYVKIDDNTVEDVTGNLELQKKAGFNEFDVFGLLVSHSWPMDIGSAVDEERRQRVNRILDAAHELGIKILYGLGVYSWGFDEIIEKNPGVQGPNPHAMCGSKPESQRWMRRVVNYILSEFAIDGFHLEASDQGRCTCPQCMKEGNVEYYSRLNAETAEYIRDKAPEKVLMVNMCGYVPWGTKVKEEDIKYLVELSRHLDFLIDPGHRGYYIDEKTRREVVRALKCDFGTSGGFWVYPPQPWNRFRWFLPYTQRTGKHIKDLYDEGGRAVEYYMGPAINPGVEVNIAFGGRLLSDASRKIDDVLTEVIEMLYKPKNEEACHKLVEVFKRAEDAYFNNWSPSGQIQMREQREFGLTPMRLYMYPRAERPWGHPTYISSMMDSKERTAYKKELTQILGSVSKIRNKIGDKERMKHVETCIRNTIEDIGLVN